MSRPRKARGCGAETAGRLLLALLGLLFALLAVELALRITHLGGARPTWSRPDPVVGWRFVPGAHYWYAGESAQPVEGRINQLGWRDRDWPAPPPPSSMRIAVLGDSFVEAFQVELEATFHSLAEDRLSARLGRPVELMSFGRSGMTQTEELLTLERDVLPTRPDAVVLFFYPGNDVDEISRATALDKLRPFFVLDDAGNLSLDTSFAHSREYRLKALLNPLLQRSALAAWLVQRAKFGQLVRRQEQIDAAVEQAPEQLYGVFTLATDHPDPTYARNYQLNRRLIGEIAAKTRAAGIPLLLAGIDFVYKPEDVAHFRAIDPSFDPDFFDNDLQSLATELGIPFLGLQRPFGERYRETGEELRWAHWNYAGHRLVAGLLAPKLVEMLASNH